MKTIDITNVGPIEAVSIPVPQDGGIVVLRGPNGAGKSIALTAVDALMREGKASPNARARDGSLGGAVEGLGRTIKVGLQRSTSRGELEVTALGDDVDVAALVDPGFKDPSAADRHRIKAALLLARVAVDVAPFAELVGGLDRLKELVRADALAAEDPVEMAERIRRDLHAAALQKEREADAREGSAKGLREAAGEVDLQLDDKAIRTEAEEAFAAKRELDQRARLAAEAAKRRAEAQATLAGTELPDVDAIRQRVEAAAAEEADATTKLAEVKAALQDAMSRLGSAQVELKAARDAEKSATALIATVDNARKAIEESSAVEGPSAEEIAAAAERVRQAHAAVERIGAVEEARKQVFAANVAAREAKEYRAQAAELRDAAKGTDEVLAKMIASFAPAGLGVYDGRLILKSGDRHKYFGELSDGERWRIALDMAIDALGDARILAISQVAWEGLDAEARAKIHAHARERQTVIVTAEADHAAVGTLRAEEFAG